MRKVNVKTSKEYTVSIGQGILSLSGEITANLKPRCKITIVSDDVVYPLYGNKVKTSLENFNFTVSSFVFPNGEHSKNMSTVTELLEFLAHETLGRSDLIVALGGGVVGDLAGFVASVYMRGVDFIQMPTTFLSAIDSSIGGKTGVNLKGGKNLSGAFHQPLAVLCDTSTFDTLSHEVFADGICEAIKYGAICSKTLFYKLLEENLKDDVDEIVEMCINIKKEFVERDEFDSKERQLLNFGHTFGHAIEALSDYTISHGRAVAMGMCLVSKAAEKLQITKEPSSEFIIKALDRYQIDHICTFTANELAQKASCDKKKSSDCINLVLLNKLGDAFIRKVPTNDLEAFVEKGLSE